MLKVSGLFAPLATPFTDDGHQVSEVRLARQIRYLADTEISGFVVATDTGEFGACGIAERKGLLELALREAAGRKEVLVNVSSLSTSVSLDLAQHAGRHGARAAVLMPPYYGQFNEEEVVGFFGAVARHAGIPVVIVDPFRAIGAGVRQPLAENPSLVWAAPLAGSSAAALSVLGDRSATDEFTSGGCIVSPLATICSRWAVEALGHGRRSFAVPVTLAQSVGRARVVKAALDVLGVPQGPTRGPVMALSGPPLAALTAFLEAE